MGVVSSEGDGGDVSHEFALGQDGHVLDGYSGQFALPRAHYQVAVRQQPHNRHPQTEQPLHRTHSLVDGLFDVDLEDIASFGAAVDIGVLVVDGCAGEMTLDVAEIGIQG